MGGDNLDNSFKVSHPWRNTRPFSCSPGIRLVRPALSGLAWRWKAKCPTPSRCRPVFPRDVGGHAPTPSRLSALSPTLSALFSVLAFRLSARLSGQTRCFSAHLSRLSGHVANRKGATEGEEEKKTRGDKGSGMPIHVLPAYRFFIRHPGARPPSARRTPALCAATRPSPANARDGTSPRPP